MDRACPRMHAACGAGRPRARGRPGADRLRVRRRRPARGAGSRPAAPAGEAAVVGAVDGPVDRPCRRRPADLEDYWAETFPEVFGEDVRAAGGRLLQRRPGRRGPRAVPATAWGAAPQPREVANNTFYCQSPGAPNSDSITYDRRSSPSSREDYGAFIPALVMAHEFGHAVQARVGLPAVVDRDGDPGRLPGRHLDALGRRRRCRALPDPARRARRAAQRISPAARPRRDRHRGGVRARLLLRPGLGLPGGLRQRAPGVPRRLRPRPGLHPGRVHDGQGLPPAGQLALRRADRLVRLSLPEFWQRAFTEVLGEPFTDPELVAVRRDGARTARPDGPGPRLLPRRGPRRLRRAATSPRPASSIGDFAVATAIAIPYALAARDQLGPVRRRRGRRPLGGVPDRLVRRAGLQPAGRSVLISPGDLDESVQFLLDYGDDPEVLGRRPDRLPARRPVPRRLPGGRRACDVGV